VEWRPGRDPRLTGVNRLATAALDASDAVRQDAWADASRWERRGVGAEKWVGREPGDLEPAEPERQSDPWPLGVVAVLYTPAGAQSAER
jgi:hypothetical protein